MKQPLVFLVLFHLISLTLPAQNNRFTNIPDGQTDRIKPGHKILVVSGGGARGAWGVGVLSRLAQNDGGRYQAVFGTSTGSLMAPLILLQQYDTLETFYGNVTQDKIFNQNPFRVSYDPATNMVTTKLKTFKAIKRLILGKKTFGETKNLLKLIKQGLTWEKYKALIDNFTVYKRAVFVGVTNTRSGSIKIISDSGFTKTKADWERWCDWMWASANEPLLMSYVPIDDSAYVDGGVREIIPIEEAVKYAADHPNIDSIEIIINNSAVPESQNWDINAGGILNGLQRILSIYNMSTVAYNENYGSLLIKYYNLSQTIPPPINPSEIATSAITKRVIHVRFYCMPDDVAKAYPNELGFIPQVMRELIQKGKNYGAAPVNCIDDNIDENTIRQFLKQK